MKLERSLALLLCCIVVQLTIGPLRAAVTQCPTVGPATGCRFLYTFNPAGGPPVVTVDAANGVFDLSDGDLLVGVQNNSGGVVSSLTLTSALPVFGFDSDGACSGVYIPTPASCTPLPDPTAYGGPGTGFTGISLDMMTGTITFTPPIPDGGSRWFSLEGSFTTVAPTVLAFVVTVCPHHRVHGHISTVPPNHVGTFDLHHGQHGHTVAGGAGCPPHAPGHTPGLMPEPGEDLFRTDPISAGEPAFVAARNQDGSAGPALRGAVVQLFGSANGLFWGEQDEFPMARVTAPVSGLPLYYTTGVPEVRIAGLPAKVLFSGLAPGLNGVWQINVLVPEEAPVGKAPLMISYDGQELRSIDITVK